jgi:solute carrier family 25 (mitochondrial citrate transporter), member 1
MSNNNDKTTTGSEEFLFYAKQDNFSNVTIQQERLLLHSKMSSSNKNKNKNPLTPMTAGCIAGGIEATAVWPMEYIKTQLQLQSKVKMGSSISTATPLPYTGMISGLTYTVRTTGFLSLYRGLTPTLLGSIPKAGIRFGLNAVIKDALRDEQGKLTAGKNFVAGLGAGISEAIIIVAPVETVKTKCIELNMSFLKGLKHILQTEGIRGVYQGVSTCSISCIVALYE